MESIYFNKHVQPLQGWRKLGDFYHGLHPRLFTFSPFRTFAGTTRCWLLVGPASAGISAALQLVTGCPVFVRDYRVYKRLR